MQLSLGGSRRACKVPYLADKPMPAVHFSLPLQAWK